MKFDKIAVLFRAAYHSQLLEMELTKENINYDFRGGLRFFERSHVKDVLAFLRILNNKNDSLSWQRILNMQTGIGAVTIKNIVEFVQTSPVLDEDIYLKIKNILSSKAQLGFSDFWKIFLKIKKKENSNPKVLIEEILDSDYREYLKLEYSDFRERIEDLKQLIFFAEKYEELNSFLTEAILQESFNKRQIENKNVVEENKIILSTIHQAKGLEWDVVFIIG